MKNEMEKWRGFLFEQNVNFQGILKLKPSDGVLDEIEAKQLLLPEEAVRLDKDDLHVTLVHQSFLKPFKKQLKNINLPEAPEVVLDDNVFERRSPGKKSWAIKLLNQDEMRRYVHNVMEILGSENTNPEPERVFHISLANSTGDPHDSVR
jgi:hypothetical protein